MRLLACLLILATGAAQAEPDLRLRALAANCAGCHGTEGRAPRYSLVPGLAGMPAAHFIVQMKAFKSGARQGTVMPQLAKGFSEAQILALANYFAAHKGSAP
ncbi:MAG: c-type cytochrome [Paucibacter sp.]|nr:c-type cytochrome [Roseateles sp.]